MAFGQESVDLADLRNTLRSSMDVHYLNAIASRAISGKARSFKGQSIENYTAKALQLDGSDFTNSVLNAVTFARTSMAGCSFSGAALQVPPHVFHFPAISVSEHDKLLTTPQRCVIEDLDLSGAKDITRARLSGVTFTRVVFKGAQLQVSGTVLRCCMRFTSPAP